MNSLSLAFLIGGWIATATGVPPDAAQKELQRFQGTWQAVSVRNPDGRPATPDELAHIRLIVDGNTFTLQGKEFAITGRFTIDPSRSPRAIDVTLDRKEGEPPVKLLGIYRIDGDVRKSCFAMPEQERPRDFPESPKGYLRLEWKQVPGDPAPRK